MANTFGSPEIVLVCLAVWGTVLPGRVPEPNGDLLRRQVTHGMRQVSSDLSCDSSFVPAIRELGLGSTGPRQGVRPSKLINVGNVFRQLEKASLPRHPLQLAHRDQ